VRLTIFGATGGTGQRLLERTIAEGHEVTAFVRSTSRMKARHERLEVVVGDVFDPEAVKEAAESSSSGCFVPTLFARRRLVKSGG